MTRETSRERAFPGSAATWTPEQTVLRARMAALARSAQTAGAEISAAGRAGFIGKFASQARELVAARQAKGERIADVEAEVARVAAVLLRMHMTDLAHHPRKARQSNASKAARSSTTTATTGQTPDPPDSQTEKDRPALGSYETAVNPLPRSRYIVTSVQARPSTTAQAAHPQSPHPTVRVLTTPPRDV